MESLGNNTSMGWVARTLPSVWEDFAGDQQGIVLTVWDVSRLLWFTRPEYCPDPYVKSFLERKLFKKWGYLPIDATGPNDKLGSVLKATIEGYDRVLAYSEWAAKILSRTFDGCEFEALPHGIDTSVFYPRERKPSEALRIGIVATNQRRKDWGLGIATCAELAKSKNIELWLHTDTLVREWDIPGLLQDFGIQQARVTTGMLSDEAMAENYSACDVTLGIGSGEGFGYPIFESLACGTPCVHGNYGGAAEWMRPWQLVEPIALRSDGIYGASRPVFSVQNWTTQIETSIGIRGELPEELDWRNVWTRWRSWLEDGVKPVQSPSKESLVAA
jgi:glycosyltransferase involved in cell wall biosynthesis